MQHQKSYVIFILISYFDMVPIVQVTGIMNMIGQSDRVHYLIWYSSEINLLMFLQFNIPGIVCVMYVMCIYVA